MKPISILNIILASTISYTALADTTKTLNARTPHPTVKVIKQKRVPANPSLANVPDGLVDVPVEVELVKGQVYDPIDGVVYEQKEVRVTPTYVKDIADPLNTVTRAVLNLSEMGWTAGQLDQLAADLHNLQTLTLIGTVPSEKYLPALRKLVGQVKDFTYNVTVKGSDQRDQALDILTDLVKSGENLRRLVIGDRLLMGDCSASTIRDLRSALHTVKHLHYFRLLPTAKKHTAWKHSEVKNFGVLLSRAPQLKYIDISGNTLGYGADGRANIREAFTTFALIDNLKALNASNNNIGSVPDDVAKVEIVKDQLKELRKLEYVELSGNEIEQGANYKEKLELIRGVIPALNNLKTLQMGQTPLGQRFFILTK